jgi:hypothetical protein
MNRLGMKPVPGITRVAVKKGKNVCGGGVARGMRARARCRTRNHTPPTAQIMFVMVKPDVFQCPGTDTYVIFGEVRAHARRAVGGWRA